MYLLGTLDSHTYAQVLNSRDRLLLNRPDPSKPSFRAPLLQSTSGSSDTKGTGKGSNKSNGKKDSRSRFKYLPLTIEKPTRTINKDPYPRTHKVLVMELVDVSSVPSFGKW